MRGRWGIGGGWDFRREKQLSAVVRSTDLHLNSSWILARLDLEGFAGPLLRGEGEGRHKRLEGSLGVDVRADGPRGIEHEAESRSEMRKWSSGEYRRASPSIFMAAPDTPRVTLRVESSRISIHPLSRPLALVSTTPARPMVVFRFSDRS
jgi:hypothetical protein